MASAMVWSNRADPFQESLKSRPLTRFKPERPRRGPLKQLFRNGRAFAVMKLLQGSDFQPCSGSDAVHIFSTRP